MTKVNLKNLSFEELENFLISIGEQKFRAAQLFLWMCRGVSDFDSMSNLSKVLIEKLKVYSYISSAKIVQKFTSNIDETKKYLFELEDGHIIESVLMNYHHGNTVCISSQIGCKMGCRFCASTLKGLVRNLETAEILDQVLSVSHDIGQRVSNIVIMGIGEPFDNYDNILKFLRIINHKEGLNIGYRHITISTCGLVDGIISLAKENIPVTLAISLHAPNDEIRKKIMPIALRYSIAEIIQACKFYVSTTNRRITFEYSMINGVNDKIEHAYELAKILKNLLCHVNLIPINKIDERDYKASTSEIIKNFQKVLRSNSIEATIRRELGKDISASCGQLRNKYNTKDKS